MSSTQHDPFRLCGTTIEGKYRVLSVVGAGGFGVVYRGVHEGFDAPIAVKCLKLPAELSPGAQEDLIRQLRDEGRLLLQLSRLSPGIVQALDVGAFTTSEGARVPYLVLEWLEGETLASHLKGLRAHGGAAMSRREAIALLEPAARALAVAHAQKIAHRDVKPENLFLADVGGTRTLKVLDFGIAKVLADQISHTEALATTAEGPSVLTPSYGAPEQFDKRRGATGPWTDVFAIALLFVELVAGKRALEGDSIAALYSTAVDPARRPTPRAHGVETPDAVERVLERALCVAPRERYPDAGAFWDALRAAEGLATPAAPDPPPAPSPLGQPPSPRGADDSVAETRSDGAAGAATRRARPAAAAQTDAPAGLAFDATLLQTTDPAPPSGLDAGSRVRGGPPSSAAEAPGRLAPTGSIAGTTAPVRAAPPRRRLLLAVATTGAVAAVIAFAALHRISPAVVSLDSARPPAPPSASASAALSGNPEAAALCQEALQAWRDGAPDVATRTMERAVALDRGLSAGHLRLAIWLFRQKPIAAREQFQLALRYRAALGERDAALLDAAEAYLRQPSDLVAWERRLEAATARYPADAELLVHLGTARYLRLSFDPAIAAYDRALSVDRGHALAWVLKGESLGMKGDVAAELEAYRACTGSSPGATLCLSNRIRLLSRQGDCQGVVDDARRWLSVDPGAAMAQRHLALALQARGAPREGVLQALEQSWALLPDGERQEKELLDRSDLAAMDGDFAQAAQHARAYERLIAPRSDQEPHAMAAGALARLDVEMGLAKEAGQVADDFLRRMGAWAEPTTAGDWTMQFIPYSYRAGTMGKAPFEAARAAWIDRVQSKWRATAQEARPQERWLLWSEAHTAFVETPEQAAEALRTMPLDQPLPSESWRWRGLDLILGKVFALTGRGREAVAPLRRVASSCVGLVEPISTVEASYYLGVALEATGDEAGAAAAYGVVLERWGRATPRSVTADKARARRARLAVGERAGLPPAP